MLILALVILALAIGYFAYKLGVINRILYKVTIIYWFLFMYLNFVCERFVSPQMYP